MKTFSEACQATMMHRGGQPVAESELPRVFEEIQRQIDPYIVIHEEIQNSPEAMAFAMGLIEALEDDDVKPVDYIRIAFSHGVMVGIEMEKQPFLVGREMPPEADPPKEAKE